MAYVELEANKKRLIIRASGYEEGQVLMGLPSRRWMPTRGVFVVPLTRMNAQLLLDASSTGKFILPNTEGTEALFRTVHREAQSREFPDPYPYRVEPFPDQRRACIKTYQHDVGALFMPPGSGKSFVVVNLFSQAHREDLIDYVLVICPLTVSTVWAGEDGQVAKYSPTASWTVGLDIRSLGPVDYSRLQWLIAGMESLSQGGTFNKLVGFFKGKRFGMLVDESHGIKNHRAIRSTRAVELGRMARMRYIATGTKITKSIIDLYNQFEFLDPDIIGVGDYFAFRSRYCKMGGYKNKQIVGYDHVEELMGLIEPYTFQCEKPQGLPAKLYTERVMQMTLDQKATYARVKKGEQKGVSVANILNRIEKLSQIAGGHLREDPYKTVDPQTGRERKVLGKIIWQLPTRENPKIQGMLEFIEEIGTDTQMVIWARHLWEIEQISSILGEGNCGVITGAVPLEDRARIIRDFQTGTLQYFVGNQPTGGVGITLTAAHYCFYYNNTFSYTDRVQSEDRLHRIGQKNEVLYCDCRMDRTVDALFKAAIEAKMDLDQYVTKMLNAAGNIEELI